MAKTKKNNFDDAKMLIATLSITMTIVFWNLFAAASSNTETVLAANIPQITATVEPMAQVIEPTPTATFVGKIILGGQAPQPRVVVVQKSGGGGGGGNNNNGGGGGGNTVTQTKSS